MPFSCYDGADVRALKPQGYSVQFTSCTETPRVSGSHGVLLSSALKAIAAWPLSRGDDTGCLSLSGNKRETNGSGEEKRDGLFVGAGYFHVPRSLFRNLPGPSAFKVSAKYS